jgi:hypothetical protein
MESGLAKTLTETPIETQPTLVDRIRQVLGKVMNPQQTSIPTQNQTPATPQWRDVRAGKPLDDYLKKEGL